jgi:NhaA family Na+:H+ antiporter
MNTIEKIKEYSLPLILGVVVAMIFANVWPELYQKIVYTPIAGEHINFNWIVNDVFMVLFFASAGTEIVNDLSPGGALNPIKKAVTPLMATAGGVLGPIAFFFVLNHFFGSPEFSNGWGITTATDIALAWLIARLIFGNRHPAVSFLLLLAVADDGIGLIIIAIFYPDPRMPVEPGWLILIVVAMLIAFVMNRRDVKSFWWYFLICGIISWFGMHNAHLHPALALVFIVPFMPHEGEAIPCNDPHGAFDAPEGTTLRNFEHFLVNIVEFGLFFFGFTNAGVGFSEISSLTFIIMISLILGKTVGISLFTLIADKALRFGLPEGMRSRDVFTAAIVGGMGLTVALFITESAFTDLTIQGAAKMGALFTVGASLIAFVVSKILRIQKASEDDYFF